jgi:hypothetical protein
MANREEKDMEFKIRENNNYELITFKHKVALQAMSMIEDKDVTLFSEVLLYAQLAFVQESCEEDVIDFLNNTMEKDLMNLMEEVLRNKSASTKLYAGLFVTFMNGTNSDLIKQIHAARKYSLNGMIIFDYAHLKKEYIDVLTESVFKPCLRDIAKAKKEEQVVVQDKKQTKNKRRFGFGRRK